MKIKKENLCAVNANPEGHQSLIFTVEVLIFFIHVNNNHLTVITLRQPILLIFSRQIMLLVQLR